NQHPGEVDPIAIVELEDLFEEVEFGLAVEAVVIEVEGPVPVADVVGEVPAGDQVRFGSESEGRSLVGGGAVPLHQLDLLLFWFLEGPDLEQGMEDRWDNKVVEHVI